RERLGGIDAAACEANGAAVEVSGEDAYRDLARLCAQHVRSQNGDRIRLLTGSAAGRPESELAAALPGRIDQPRSNGFAAVGKHLRVAEEVRPPEQHAADESLLFVGVIQQVAPVAGERLEVGGAHPAL